MICGRGGFTSPVTSRTFDVKDRGQPSAQFVQLNGLVGIFSGGTISFDRPQDAPATIAKCGLMSKFVVQVKT